MLFLDIWIVQLRCVYLFLTAIVCTVALILILHILVLSLYVALGEPAYVEFWAYIPNTTPNVLLPLIFGLLPLRHKIAKR